MGFFKTCVGGSSLQQLMAKYQMGLEPSPRLHQEDFVEMPTQINTNIHSKWISHILEDIINVSVLFTVTTQLLLHFFSFTSIWVDVKAMSTLCL